MNTRDAENSKNSLDSRSLLQARLYRTDSSRKDVLVAYEALLATWQVEYRSRYVATEFGKTHVIETIPPRSLHADSKPIVLIPGGQGTAGMWGPLMPTLCASHQAFSLDLIDQVGRSSPTRILENPEDANLWLTQTLDALGLQRINLMGNSIGSYIAAEFSMAHSERVNRLVLTAPASTFAHIRIGYVVSVLLTLLSPFKRSKQRFIANSANHRGNLEDPLNKLLISAMSGTRVISKLTPSMLSDSLIESFEVPTLAIFGECDSVNSMSSEEIVAKLKGIKSAIRFEMIADAGHIFTPADLEFCAEKANEFFQE